MHIVTLLGAGKIGETIAAMLAGSGRYHVRLADINEDRAKKVAAHHPGATSAHQIDLGQRSSLEAAVKGSHALVSALPYYCNPQVAELAIEMGVHYLDLTEDVKVTQAVTALASSGKAKRSNVCLIPQCGLAPGFISIAAMHLARSFEKLDTLKMRVGALPIYPSNRLKYNLTWSTEGLINEYGNMCEAIEDGALIQVLPLEGYERFSLDGTEYEAFNTSGGLGSLCTTLRGKVRNLDYKSVRYPGHRDLVAFLMRDMRFNDDRDTLRKVFERSIPTTHQDKCLIFVEAVGIEHGTLVQRTYASMVYNGVRASRHFGAIQLTTAAGICAPLDMLLSGTLSAVVTASRDGVIKCEDIPLDLFLQNEFGAVYKDERALSGISR